MSGLDHFSLGDGYKPQSFATAPILNSDQGNASRELFVQSSFLVNTPARAAQSRGVRAMTPTPSKLSLNVKMPSSGTDPGRNLTPYRPLQLAGNTAEPVVSVPIAMGQKPASTLTADPEEEPPGVSGIVSRVPLPQVTLWRGRIPQLTG